MAKRRSFKSILIFNPFGIGDVLFSTPLIRILRGAYPDCRITYICNSRVRFILENNPCLNDIIIFEKDNFRNLAAKSKLRFIYKLFYFLMKIRSVNADLMIDLSLNYQASFIAGLIGIRKRVGFNYRDRGKFLTDKINLDGFEDKHVVSYYMDLLRLIGMQEKDFAPETFSAPSDDEWAAEFLKNNHLSDNFIVGIVAGGGRSWGDSARYRRWPVSNFAVIADRLMNDYNASIILFGDKKEEPLCSELESLTKTKVVNLGGKTHMSQFMSLVKKCRFLLCNEGGPLHIAVALGVPTVSIFGPVNEKVYGPFSKDMSRHEIVTKDIDCRPCYSKFKHKKCDPLKCLHDLSVDKVYGSVKKLIERIR